MRKFRIPYIPYRSLLLSTTVLNDICTYTYDTLHIFVVQPCLVHVMLVTYATKISKIYNNYVTKFAKRLTSKFSTLQGCKTKATALNL